MRSRVKTIGLLGIGAFFGFAPLWAKYVQTIAGRGIFVTPDAMVLLGVTLLVSLLASYLLPNIFVPSPKSQVSSPNPRVPVFRSMVHGLWSIVALASLVWILYLINQHILHFFLSSADEHSCYFLAECLRKGKLFVEMPQHADFFKVVHVGMRDGKWFSVYPPGWPLIWALGLEFKIVDWLNPVMSALSILFFYLSGKRLFGLWSRLGQESQSPAEAAPKHGALVSVVGLSLCVLNPFFMFTAASYFSHATCLLCISVFLYAFLRWREGYVAGRDPMGWASLCALAVGYGLMTRYLTMAAVVVPFLLFHYLPIFIGWEGWGKGVWRLPFNFKTPRLRKSDWAVIGIIAAFTILILWQSYLVTGKLFKAPNKYDKSWERLGFRKDYTIIDAFFYLIARIFYLMDWFAPAIVGAYLFLIAKPLSVILSRAKDLVFGFFVRPKRGRTQNDEMKKNADANSLDSLRTLFRLTPVFIAFAYFFYYSWGGNQWGPRYLWEGMPFLCIAVADWLVRLWRDRGLRVKKFILAFVIMALVTSGLIFARQAEFTEEASRQRRALYDLAEQTIQGQGIVFIHGFLGSRLVMAEEDAIRNSPFLDNRILYAHDLGDRNKELMAAYPGRTYYRGTYDRERLIPRLERLG